MEVIIYCQSESNAEQEAGEDTTTVSCSQNLTVPIDNTPKWALKNPKLCLLWWRDSLTVLTSLFVSVTDDVIEEEPVDEAVTRIPWGMTDQLVFNHSLEDQHTVTFTSLIAWKINTEQTLSFENSTTDINDSLER